MEDISFIENFKPQNPDFVQLIHKKLEGQHFMRLIGFDLTKIEAGYVEGEAPLIQALTQQDGLVHGGITATVADIVTGFAAFTLVKPTDRVVTADLKVSYFKPGKGEKIIAKGKVVKAGSRLHFCECDIFVSDKGNFTLIAKAYSIMAVLNKA